jgi:demethylmenaquinone methyltransferase/2-methoxy-6-polyprenyl-1,4-benzoquinol methylase
MPQTDNVSSTPVHVPHQPLGEYYQDEAQRAAFLHEIFNTTAPDYDRVEAMLAFGTGPAYRHRALQRAGLSEGMQVLDVGFGTGLVAAQAIRLTGDASRVVGVDPSPGMMQASPLAATVKLLTGKAEALPVDDATQDFVSMGYALRHVSDVEAAFREYFRVLRPGGRVCVLEITPAEGKLANAALKFYMRHVVPLASRLRGVKTNTPKIWRYYWDSIEACAPPARILETLRAVGFTEVKRYTELGIFSEYTATKPQA